MVSFERDPAGDAPPAGGRDTKTPPPPAAHKPVAETANADFEKRYGRKPTKRAEFIRFTAISKFMGRWSAP